MKYAGMPAGMWLLFSGSFNKHLREVLGYDTSTAKDITAKAKVRYAKIISRLPEFEKEVAAYKQQDEDVLTYALFPEVALDYFKYRDAQQTGVDVRKADAENKAYPV